MENLASVESLLKQELSMNIHLESVVDDLANRLRERDSEVERLQNLLTQNGIEFEIKEEIENEKLNNN